MSKHSASTALQSDGAQNYPSFSFFVTILVAISCEGSKKQMCIYACIKAHMLTSACSPDLDFPDANAVLAVGAAILAG
jgi:hypothetical protein